MRSNLVVSIAAIVLVGASGAWAKTSCELKYTLSGWSAIYRKASGHGRVTCDNGQAVSVNIRLEGAGAIAGKTKIDDGTGKFSEVENLNEIFGSYAVAEAGGGAVKAGEAQVVTKGPVTLALAGKGRGWELGVAGGKFTITKAAPRRRRAAKHGT